MKEQEMNRHWKKVINTMNEGLIMIGMDGSIVMVNQAFEKLTGYLSHELIGRPCTVLNCDACERATQKPGVWCSLFEKGKEVTKRCMLVRKDGSHLKALKNASILTDDRMQPIGAVETITDISELDRLDREVNLLSRRLEMEGDFYGLIGKSEGMHRVFEVIRKAARSEAPVIVSGESGSGKELVAQAIHQLGPRRDKPFVQLNCAALNEALLESELFGHIKGAFTGAYRHRQGRFEAANGGDFFLDEIGDLPLSIQIKLLRVLETKEFEQVGDHRTISVDVRIITATNKDLKALIAQNTFREDFFFRINVIPIHLPPLRDRMEDIPLLINAFMRRIRSATGKNITGLTHAAMEKVMAYRWPGNVRELKSALEYAFVIAEKGLIEPDHLPLLQDARREVGTPETGWRHSQSMDEKKALIRALRQSNGNQSEAARVLGINRVTVWNRMKKYGIDLKRVMVSDPG
ncbi:MAG: PAS domain S-box protein [Desulfobacteraceae bacterium]|nr:MAG: PAS domain S-box protein [Desulfobacteraceae bacterium]